MFGNYCKQHTGGRVWACPTLLPITESRWRETKLGGELRLAQSHLPSHLADIDIRYLN
jgi:hypothetical protein